MSEEPQTEVTRDFKRRSAVFLALLFLGFVLLKAPFVATALEAFCLVLAKITAGLLSLVDTEVHREGIVYYRSNWGSAIAVTKDCGAFTFSLAVACAILVMRMSIWQKATFLFLSLVAIQVANIIRLAGLLYGRVLLPQDAFNTLHYQIFPLIFCLFTQALIGTLILNEWKSGQKSALNGQA